MGAAGTSSLPNDTVAKQGLLALQRDFPSGATDPVNIVVDGSADDPGVAAGPDAPARPSSPATATSPPAR